MGKKRRGNQDGEVLRMDMEHGEPIQAEETGRTGSWEGIGARGSQWRVRCNECIEFVRTGRAILGFGVRSCMVRAVIQL